MPAAFEFTTETDVPDLERLLSKLAPAQLTGAMKNVGEAGVGLAQEAFDKSKSPDGTSWPQLQESTLKAWVGRAKGRRRRSSYGKRPLVRTATMMRSINWRLLGLGGDVGVAVGASQAAAVFHQGDPDHPSKGIIPRRAFLPIAGQALPDAWRDELVDAVESYLSEGGDR